MKHYTETARVVHEFETCDKDFHSFCLMREHKRNENGAQRGSGAQNVDTTQLMRDGNDNSFEKEVESCKHFLLDSEKEIG